MPLTARLSPRMPASVAAVGLLALVGGMLGPVGSAAAATTVTVTVASDAALTAGCDDGAAGTTLREALCAASADGDAVVVVPDAMVVSLSQGPLVIAPAGPATITVTSPGTFVVDGKARRILDIDPLLVGGVDVTLSHVELRNGAPDATDAAEVAGGGAILAGSGTPGAPDTLRLSDCSVHHNANGPRRAAAPGGAVQMTGGRLEITRCTFTDNTSDGAPGGAVAMLGVDGTDTMTVTDSVFTRNTVTGTDEDGVLGGGAIWSRDVPLTITGSAFTANSVTAPAASGVRGSAVLATGPTSVVGSDVAGNTVTGAATAAGAGAALALPGGGTVTATRLVGNTETFDGSSGRVAVRGPVSVTGSWWGCTGGPGAPGCDTAVEATAVAPYATLTTSVSPAVPAQGAVTTVTASLRLSDGTPAAPALLARMAGRPVTWAFAPVSGADAPSSDLAVRTDGTARTTYTTGAATAVDVTATFDGAAVTRTVQRGVPPTVGAPGATTVAEGSTAVLEATVDGYPTATVRWETAPAGGTTWTDVVDGPGVTGATTNRLQVTAHRSLDGRQYRMVASNLAGTTTSPAATLSVTWGPQVTEQPTDTTAVAGGDATFRVTVAGNPVPGVQWQTRASGAATWEDVPGATGATYTRTTVSADNGLEVRARVTGAGPAVDSASAVLTVREAPVFTTQPVDATVDAGTTVTLTAAAVGRPAPSVRWQVRTAGGAWEDVPGATGWTLAVVAADDGREYRALASNAAAQDVASSVAALHVLTPPGVSDPQDMVVGVGGTARFAVTVTGSPTPVISWETSPDGAVWTPVPGASGASFDLVVAATDDGLQVRARASSTLLAGPRTAVSAAATVAIAAPPALVSGPDGVAPDATGTVPVTAGTPMTFSYTVDGVGPTATWLASRDGGATWGPLPAGAVTQDLVVGPVSSGLMAAVGTVTANAVVATRTTFVVRYTPTAADDGLLLRLRVTTAAGTIDLPAVALDVPAAGGGGSTGGGGSGGTGGTGGAGSGGAATRGTGAGAASAAPAGVARAAGLSSTGASAVSTGALALALTAVGAMLLAARRRRES
ncbi:immunoglobulin domain-containing protein [Actinotalea subterranea]|uniref:immunoglobulin domain-containing protein n=1 Tax=Actinotalea subterranea TaxID=2607497 RepID=UPI0011EE0078|nr:immunoglobulin domain-containing protein [Actinotalea subterranea]